MKVIYKYVLETTDEIQVVSGLDYRSNVRYVGEQSGKIVMWVEQDMDTDSDQSLNFVVRGTGHPWQDDSYHQSLHMGTVQMESGLVWHLFRIHDIRPYYERSRNKR